MGVEASSEAAAARTLAQLEGQARLLEPVRVCTAGPPATRIRVDLPLNAGMEFSWTAEIEAEDGRSLECGGTAVASDGETTLEAAAAARLGPGYHRLRLNVTGAVRAQAEQALLVTPRLPLPAAAFGFGVYANLYTVRSADNLGFGNVGDLRRLIEWTGRVGGTFVALNPLHALSNRGDGICPYHPLSRLFYNPLYLDVFAVPEFRTCPQARRIVSSSHFAAEASDLRAAARIEHERIERLLDPLLSVLHGEFRSTCIRGGDRSRAYDEFRREHSGALDEFATFVVLGKHLERCGLGDRGDWRTWPQEFRRPGSEAVVRFAAEHESQIAMQCFVQFELDRQVRSAAGAAAESGLEVGLIGDLAVGSAPGGADAWSHPELFAQGVTIGAPPDAFCPVGQDWRLAPMLPGRLREGGWRLWRALVRRALGGMGGLRVDHAMGLERLYWVAGDAARGAYVRMPAEVLLAVLAIEGERSGSVLVAEDLGTVPEGLRERLAEWGLLRTQVLYFERDRAGDFRSATDYAGEALVTANTHDLPTLAGFWTGSDIEVLCRSSLIDSAEAARRVGEREHERAALCERLARDGMVPGGWRPRDHTDLCAAVHSFLGRTPGRLVSVALDDLAGEREAVNVPGLPAERGGSWTRRMTRSLEDLAGDRSAVTALGDLPERRGRARRTG